MSYFPPADYPPALNRAWQALGRAGVEAVRIVCNGDSNIFGLYNAVDANVPTYRWTTQVGRLLQQRWNYDGQIAGQSYMGMDTVWTLAGTTAQVTRGLGFQSLQLSAAATMSKSFSNTDQFTILFESGAGTGAQFTVTIDGGAPVTVTPNNTGTQNYTETWVSGALTKGTHTLLITAVGTAVISAVYAHSGDQSTGIQVWTGGLTGSTSGTGMNETNFQCLKLLAPKIIFYQLLSNDFAAQTSLSSYKLQVSNYIERALFDNPNATIILCNTHYRAQLTGSDAIKQKDYIDVWNDLAAERPQSVVVLNLADSLPIKNPADFSSPSSLADPWSIYADSVHMRDAGHTTTARKIAGEVLTPTWKNTRRAATDFALPTPILEWKPETLSALADNASVTSWASTGTDTSALVSAGGNAPVYKTTAGNNAKPIVRFATNQSLVCTFAAPITEATLLVLHKMTNTTQNYQNLIQGLASGNWWHISHTVSDNRVRFGWTNTDHYTTAGAGYVIGGSAVFGITLVQYKVSKFIGHFNQLVTSRIDTTWPDGGAVSGITVGGDKPRFNFFFTGDIRYIGVFPPDLTAAQRSQLIKYWAADQSLTVVGGTSTTVI